MCKISFVIAIVSFKLGLFMKLKTRSKSLLIVVGFLLLNVTNLFSQTYKATYSITYQPDSTNIHSRWQEKAYLFIQNQTSYYGTENYLKKDSILQLVNSGKVSAYEIMANKSNLFTTKFTHFVKKDSQTGLTIYEDCNIDVYQYKMDIPFTWNISSTTAVVNGYDCFKAITHFAGRDYEAWFTKEIPISDGPFIFSGLPGLIIKVQDVKSHYVFELIGFESFERPFVKTIARDPGKIIVTDRETVFKIREESRKDPIGSLDRSFGATSILSAADKENMRKKIAANNNPLELRLN